MVHKNEGEGCPFWDQIQEQPNHHLVNENSAERDEQETKGQNKITDSKSLYKH